MIRSNCQSDCRSPYDDIFSSSHGSSTSSSLGDAAHVRRDLSASFADCLHHSSLAGGWPNCHPFWARNPSAVPSSLLSCRDETNDAVNSSLMMSVIRRRALAIATTAAIWHKRFYDGIGLYN
jgi:hypothetical protein